MSAIGNRWALIGPGAIGLYYGGFLAQRGVELHVLARSDADVMKADGIRVRMVDPVTEVLDDDFSCSPNKWLGAQRRSVRSTLLWLVRSRP